MKIVVMSWLERCSVEAFLHRSVGWRPDLATRPAAAVAAELAALQPAVVMVRAAQATQLAAIEAQLKALLVPPARLPRCIVIGRLAAGEAPVALPTGWMQVQASSWEAAEHQAFLQAEALCRPQPALVTLAAEGPREVLLVGAGVVNLVTALVLHLRGHVVELIDRMANPLRHAQPRYAGASFSGRGARIFSFNEARHHLCDAAGGEFRRTLAEGGWLSRPLDSLTRADRAWIDALEAVPPWLARRYDDDIIGFNRTSESGWQRLFSLCPELLAGANHVGRLLRVYPTPAALAAARTAEAGIGALLGELAPDALAVQEPALAEAVARGAVAGALQVRGFSLDLHRFCRNIVAFLQREGVRLHWEQPLDELRFDTQGRLSALVIGGGHRAVHDVVISPGAFGSTIQGRLAGLPTIGAMAGAWVTLPNDGEPLATPLKVRRQGFAGDAAAQGANVVPAHDAAGRAVLHCSSGHGFLGLKAGNLKVAAVDELARCVLETAETLFPDKFAQARRLGWLEGPPACCVRPWTPSGLGVLGLQPTAAGGTLVFSGGHNTGGFAQSPAVAQAVACALEGRAHPMHALYHPARAAALCEAAA